MVSIEELQTLSNARCFQWTAHVMMRMQERNIEPSDVRHCITTGRIIEQYPADYPFPSCLVGGLTVNMQQLHVVIGVGNNKAWVVTAYWPDPNEWDDGYKRKKEGNT